MSKSHRVTTHKGLTEAAAMAAAKAYAKEFGLKFVEVAAYPIWSNEEWGRVSVVRDGAASALIVREF